MKLIIQGYTPSKKNGKRLVRRGNRTIPISSKNYMDWNKSAVEQLSLQFRGLQIIDYPILVKIVFYPKYKHRQDLTNRAESVMDSLVDAGIIEDDDMTHVGELNLKFGGYDKENPRAEIYLDD